MADDTTTNFVKTYAGIGLYALYAQINGALYVPLNSMEQFIKLSAYVKDGNISISTPIRERIRSPEINAAATAVPTLA